MIAVAQLHLRIFPLPPRTKAVLVAQALAVVWWLVALYFRNSGLLLVWDDQQATFSKALRLFHDPYSIPGFVNLPWTLIPLLPFNLLPLPISVLLQLGVYFAALTLIIFKLGGNLKVVLLALTSPILFNGALELSIDWIVCLGLLVPPMWSTPFLLTKPQAALGYALTFRPRDMLRGAAVALVILLLSFIVWGMWIPDWWRNIQTFTFSRPAINLAPSVLLPRLVSYAIGLVLCWRGFRTKDPVQAIIGWLFFVPYITYYSLLLPFSLLAARFPRIMLVVSIALWILLGRFLVELLL